MNHIIVKRTEETKGEDGFMIQTVGELELYDKKGGTLLYSCKSLEKGWRNNIKNSSCIPPEPHGRAEYTWRVMEFSPLFSYKHIILEGVPKREQIKIHRANRYDQLKGCIAVGTKLAYLPGDDVIDVVESTKAMTALIDALTTHTGTIEILSLVSQPLRRLSIEVVDLILPAQSPSIRELDSEA